MLEIAIHHHAPVGGGVIHAGNERHLVAEAGGQHDRRQRRIRRAQALHDVFRPVGAPVDDEDDARLVAVLERVELLTQYVMEVADHGGFVEHGADDVQRLHACAMRSRIHASGDQGSGRPSAASRTAGTPTLW